MIALHGCIAGLIATVPMTLFMVALFKLLPRREQYSLPPREITMSVAEKLNVIHTLDEPKRRWLTMACHFGYGGLMGGIYSIFAHQLSMMAIATGVVFGLLVWILSYFVALPLLNLFPAPDAHPPRRNALMIGAHVIWGAVLGLTFDLLQAG